MDRMFTSLNKKYPNNLIYIIGATSVGKSTFVNLVLKKYAETVDLITTSMQANTTSNLIKIGVGKNRLKEESLLSTELDELRTNAHKTLLLGSYECQFSF